MEASEFALFRKHINKTQTELACLLGISESSILEYESNLCAIPPHIERQMFFLISRIRSSIKAKRPCWVVKNCPEERKLVCPAWEFRAGTICWFINGTICKGTVHKNWQTKMEVCRDCIMLTSLYVGILSDYQLKPSSETIPPTLEWFEQIIGKDPKMQAIYNLIRDIAATNAIILIQGDSGTGKELVARAIHRTSHRKNKPFIVINCSAYPETLLESELFGYEQGAFTGARKRKIGRFELANGGSVFLDEIGEISPSAQVKLLRVLQDQKFERIGGNETISVDVRVITATNKNLLQEVKDGRFREDLFYRLSVIPIILPNLRERQNDIPLLAYHFLERFSMELGKEITEFSSEAMKRLMNYSWPGNVRELENAIEYSVVLVKNSQIEVNDLPSFLNETSIQHSVFAESNLVGNERQLILKVLKDCNWNKIKAARKLGIGRSSLYSKMKRLKIKTKN
jgi:transcriptional regulator with GAF, ATPase, and Fis domain